MWFQNSDHKTTFLDNFFEIFKIKPIGLFSTNLKRPTTVMKKMIDYLTTIDFKRLIFSESCQYIAITYTFIIEITAVQGLIWWKKV